MGMYEKSNQVTLPCQFGNIVFKQDIGMLQMQSVYGDLNQLK